VKRRLAQLRRPFEARGIEVLAISAATGTGVGPLLERVWHEIAAARAAQRNANLDGVSSVDGGGLPTARRGPKNL